jgi:hypothetical protein
MVRGLWSLLVVASACCGTMAAEPIVEVEIYTEPGYRADQSRVWFSIFDELKVGSIRVREGKNGDGAKIESVGEPPRLYRVSGVLTRANVLKLPGGSFGLGEKAKIAAWLTKLKAGGEEGLFEKPVALGLTERQLTAAKKLLARRISVSTQGQALPDLVDKLSADVGVMISLAPGAAAKLAEADKFADELSGLTVGTALAAVLRPAGLVLTAEKLTADSVKLSIVDSQAGKEPWPVGWSTTRPPREFVPDIMKFIPVEVEDTPLNEVVTAIQGRLKIPFVFDQNSLVRERVDLEKTKITLPKANTYYQKVLERALFQAKLKMELRTDEADQPLLWITTIKQ